MTKATLSCLEKIISKFSKTRVLVLGDLMLDEFIWGKVSRISPEAPVPVVRVEKESFMPGGASNVANNIAALSGKAVLAGVVGDDNNAALLRKMLIGSSISTAGVITAYTVPTTVKSRVIAHQQQVVRIDREKTVPYAKKISERLVSFVKKAIVTADALIIEDYGKGVVTPYILTEVVRIAKAKKKIIIVDPKEEHFSLYRGVTAITPNQNETAGAVGFPISDSAALAKAGRKLLKKFSCKYALVTLGEKGMQLFQKGIRPIHIPTMAQDVYDVSGAGDTVVATFTLALAAGASAAEAAYLANCAAGVVVGKLGTAIATKDDLLERLKEEAGG